MSQNDQGLDGPPADEEQNTGIDRGRQVRGAGDADEFAAAVGDPRPKSESEGDGDIGANTPTPE